MYNQIPDTFPSLFAGYTVIWLVLALYLYSLQRRLRRLERLAAKEDKNNRVGE